MHLIHRASFGQLLQSDIDEFIEECVAKGTDWATPQDLDGLRPSVEAWIRGKTEYAILSHRWLGEGELTFQDISKFAQLSAGGFLNLINKSNRTIHGGADILDQVIGLTKNNANKTLDGSFKLLDAMEQLCQHLKSREQKNCRGFMKLIQFCRISLRYKCCYVWFDTGCIDKSSSAELEESIRSMFTWYHTSQICIVHLAETKDVQSLRQDPWFTRGWTLQELLAPKRVKFYGKSWKPVTTNSLDNDKHSNVNHPLWHHISDITGISYERIFDFKPGIHQARDAFVWLSKRRTTRIEDMAYCLIGLLDIPLSIAYGEGEKAFYRLQVEILQRTPGMGLFIWQGQPATDNSMLATGPHCFSPLALHPLYTQAPTDDTDQSHSFTSHGLRIPLSVHPIQSGTWHITGDMSGDLVLEALDDQELKHVTMKVRTFEDYQSVELAVLGKVEGQSPGQKHGLAILLGFKNNQWKRITSEPIILPRPIDTVWRTRFIR